MKYNKSTLFFIVFIILIVIVLTVIGMNRNIEKFEDKKQSASEEVVKALQKIIRTANTVGRRMLSPKMWQDRLDLINKSPMELARMHIINNS